YLKNTAKIFATPNNGFGFPFDKARYCVNKGTVAGASNTVPNMLLPMIEYISEPFLLEKIVLEFTGSMFTNGSDNSGFSAISTFFILNQLNTQFTQTNYGYISDSPLTNYPITSSTAGMDLVTYMQIAALTSSLLSNGASASLNHLFERDLSIYQNATEPVIDSYGLNVNFGYSGSFTVSASLRKPKSLNYAGRIKLWAYDGFTNLKIDLTLDNRSGNRKMISEPCVIFYCQQIISFLAGKQPLAMCRDRIQVMVGICVSLIFQLVRVR
ncbi:MAG: hypothetical protein NTV31_17270, partial [Bacteroidia bacterium]|nr:hypothetical protein [Bacteroidia bacterium]